MTGYRGRVTRLIILNGPPGCGKSALAQMYADEHPLTLNLDIDRVRALLGSWHTDAHHAGLMARAIALSAARTHAGAGHDVIVPQYLGQVTFLEQIEQLAADIGAEFHEIVLMDSKENALRRFAARSRGSADAAHREAQQMLDLSGGPTALADMYDRLMSIVDQRAAARVIPSVDGQPQQTYQLLMDCLSR